MDNTLNIKFSKDPIKVKIKIIIQTEEKINQILLETKTQKR